MVKCIFVCPTLNRRCSNCTGVEILMKEKLCYDEQQASYLITDRPNRTFGCLMYLMLSIRSDLSPSFNYFSRFQSLPLKKYGTD